LNGAGDDERQAGTEGPDAGLRDVPGDVGNVADDTGERRCPVPSRRAAGKDKLDVGQPVRVELVATAAAVALGQLVRATRTVDE